MPLSKLATSKLCWYLLHVGVYHPQKPNKICVVFNSAAEVDGVSLNKLLLSVPDFTNTLLEFCCIFTRIRLPLLLT